MKDQLLSIADYIESLEQRVAALESANIALQDTINALQDNLSDMEARLVDMPQQEPEVEVELLLDEEEEMPEIQETPDTQDFSETQEPEPEPEPAPAPTPAPEPAPAPTPEPARSASFYGPQVTDIRQAISLGDRFLFQRELFSNNGELMQKTLDEINACADIDEAMQRIAHFGWDIESTTYKLLLNVLKRRFGI